jgi:ATP-dependent helicase/nuclease subunit A
MSLLNVYKASAGSGKTFHLTLEYLRIIFRNPNDFRRALAVTFTHKATGEMQQRIIQELSRLARNELTVYSELFCQELGLSRMELSARAKLILSLILHHYTRFQISTIDSFFQGIIASFARDLGLQSNYSVELDSEKVLNAAVDMLLLKMDQNPEIQSWIVRFAVEKISTGQRWDMRDDIRNLGRELFRERYMAESRLNRQGISLAEMDRFLEVLKKETGSFEQRMKRIGKHAIEAIQGAGLATEDFIQKMNGPAGYFHKLEKGKIERPNTHVQKCIENAENWVAGSSRQKAQIVAIAAEKLLPLLIQSQELLKKEYRVYKTSQLLLTNFYTLGLLHELDLEIMNHVREKNIFLLAHAPLLIQGLTEENDAPFIYEKAGNAYNYYMIDEFQDTSVLQWNNFRPLIHNSLASGYSCMLVGDIKQAIYRWRNSSWRTLAFLDKEEQQVKVSSLNKNWRSKPAIIRFNNTCFLQAAEQLQEKFNVQCNALVDAQINPQWEQLIRSAYADVLQNWPDNLPPDEGLVRISFVQPTEEENTSDESDGTGSVDGVLPEIKRNIDEILSKGYHLRDIAILVRRGTEGSKVAEYLVTAGNGSTGSYRVITDDSLTVMNSGSVRLIVALITYLMNSADRINNAYLIAELTVLESKKQSLLFNESLQASLFAQPEETLNRLLPASFKEKAGILRQLPVFDLAETLIILFGLSSITDEKIYLQAFLDAILECNKNASSDIASFLEWWEENARHFTISASGEQDAIRISTIHKAKGLQYKAVIIPYCNWEIDHPPNLGPMLWCTSDLPLFKNIRLLPFKYSSAMSETLFAAEYMEEKLQAFVDSLNLLYVAFTRAIEALYIICPEPGRKNTQSVSTLVKSVITSAINLNDQGASSLLLQNPAKYWDESSQLFSYGILAPGKVNSGIALPPLLHQTASLPEKKVSIRMHSEDYFLPITNQKAEEKINKGILLHEAFSRIKTLDTMEAVLQSLVNEGKISSNEAIEMLDEIHNLTSNPLVEEWFGGAWKVLSETAIVCRGRKLLRPDRVLIRNNEAMIIDFKFGETMLEKYHEQVSEYMDSIKEMGYGSVKGYVWYVKMNKIHEVN